VEGGTVKPKVVTARHGVTGFYRVVKKLVGATLSSSRQRLEHRQEDLAGRDGCGGVW
jgi:hypothetical protein